ncbi:MAG: class B sortase [Clostridia bacterium]|nr:class B sortase [Clostridia bacterium]
MADKFTFDPKEMDIRELMRLLDEMQSRTHNDEVEELLIDGGHITPVRPDVYIPPTVGAGYDPSTTPGALAEMLITPEEVMEIEELRRMERQARLQQQEEEEDDALPPPPADRRNPLAVLGSMLAAGFPRRGDTVSMLAVKGGLFLGTVAVLAAVAILLMQMVVLPAHNRQYNDKLAKWFDPDNTTVVTDTEKYPEGMLSSFKRLYRTNSDVKGWLSFHSEGEKDYLDIDYPVVQTDDNTTYINQDFHGRYNKNGTLFFDEKCVIENGNTNRSLILYGNSLGNGQMLSGLNQLISNEAYARDAYHLTLSTLYEQSDYYVFAVLLRDKIETVEQRILPLQNRFITNDTFLDYVQDLRDRSLFDYPTDITDTDSLLLLVTDLGSMNGVMDDAQVVVAARRARPGEQPFVATDITPNEDVLMPYRWYSVQGKVIPDIYRGKEMEEETTTLPTNNPFDSTTNGAGATTSSTASTVSSTIPTVSTTAPTVPPTTTTTTTTAATTTTTTTEAEDTTPSETNPTETELETTDPTEIEE